jgi:hypothetical protein
MTTKCFCGIGQRRLLGPRAIYYRRKTGAVRLSPDFGLRLFSKELFSNEGSFTGVAAVEMMKHNNIELPVGTQRREN